MVLPKVNHNKDKRPCLPKLNVHPKASVKQLSVVALTKLPAELKIYFLLKMAVCVLWTFRTMGVVRGPLFDAPVHRYGDLYFVSES